MQNMKSQTAIAAATGISALLVSLAGCSTMSASSVGEARPAKETISYTVGPCFGFCPVYSLELLPTGHITYVGERHTAVVGTKEGEAGEKAYGETAKALASFHPVDGTTTDTECEQRRTDAQHYVITWTKPDGTKTVLQHDRGCMSAKNTELNKTLDTIPARLGIGEWAKQHTEPGATRG